MSKSNLKVIVTADDFGYSRARNRGIVKAYQQKAITRTSFMVNALHAKDAAEKYHEYQIPAGLHLNLLEGDPVSPPDKLPSILDSNGHFLDRYGMPAALAQNKVDFSQVELEIRAQIEKFKSLCGKLPFYVDGHQHAHILPGICKVFAEVLQSYGIKETRLSFDVNIESSSWLDGMTREAFLKVNQNSLKARAVFDAHNITYACFVGNGMMSSFLTKERILRAIQNTLQPLETFPNKPGTVELMTHVGFPTNAAEVDISSEGCGLGSDDFDQSADREYELNLMCGNEIKQLWSELKAELVSSCV